MREALTWMHDAPRRGLGTPYSAARCVGRTLLQQSIFGGEAGESARPAVRLRCGFSVVGSCGVCRRRCGVIVGGISNRSLLALREDGRWGTVVLGWRTLRPPRVVFVLGFVSLEKNSLTQAGAHVPVISPRVCTRSRPPAEARLSNILGSWRNAGS